MTATKNTFDRMLEDVQRQREELNLQLHLAKAEARDEWQALEQKWQELKPKLDAAGSEAMKSGENALTGLQMALEELRKGYGRVKDRLR